MKKMLSTLLMACVMATGVAQACHHEKMHEKLEKIATKLDLSKEQRAQVHAIREESKQKLASLHEQLKSVRDRVNEAYRAHSMNSFKLNGFVRQEKEIVGQMIKIRMDERYKINELLTEKQRTQFLEMIEHWKKEHHKKKKHH